MLGNWVLRSEQDARTPRVSCLLSLVSCPLDSDIPWELLGGDSSFLNIGHQFWRNI